MLTGSAFGPEREGGIGMRRSRPWILAIGALFLVGGVAGACSAGTPTTSVDAGLDGGGQDAKLPDAAEEPIPCCCPPPVRIPDASNDCPVTNQCNAIGAGVCPG
jgi:hypothetical protein